MARSYFSYSVIRSDSSTSLTQYTGGNSILTALANVDWEVKKINASTNLPENTAIYQAATGNATIAGSNGTTEANGLIEFWANPGLYVIEITDPQARIGNKNLYWDSVSGQTGGIPGDNIESESITTTQIEDGQVSTDDIEPGAITSALIAPSGVQSSNLGAAVVKAANIDDGAVTSSKLGSGAVTAGKIGPGAVDASNLAPGTIPSVDAFPAGVIFPYAASGASAPSGWLFCDGSSVSTSTYPNLFAAIGTTYGGSGGASFNLPDLRGRVPAGKDNMSNTVGSSPSANRLDSSGYHSINSITLGSTGGNQAHTLSEAQLASHNHSQNSHGHSQTGQLFSDRDFGPSGNNYVSGSKGGSGLGGPVAQWGISSTTASNNPAGGGQAHNNVQPTIILNYIIKAS